VTRFMRSAVLALFAALGFAGSAAAADYPNHPVKWVVPDPPGGTTDLLARFMAAWLSDKMGQPFLIENKPGGGNNIGVEYVVKSAPDGYTMLLVNPANGINTTLYKNLPFNFLTDIAPVAGIARSPNVMVVRPNFPAKNVAEFIDYCKKNPGKINMASSGSGTSVHLSGELFKTMTGCQMVHVPYKGAGPALTDLIGGQVQMLITGYSGAVPHIKSGKLRALGVSGAKRLVAAPDLPTIGETVKGYEAVSWYGIFAPARTPRAIVTRLADELRAMTKRPQIVEKLVALGIEPEGTSPEEFAQQVKQEIVKWGKVVRVANVPLE